MLPFITEAQVKKAIKENNTSASTSSTSCFNVIDIRDYPIQQETGPVLVSMPYLELSQTNAFNMIHENFDMRKPTLLILNHTNMNADVDFKTILSSYTVGVDIAYDNQDEVVGYMLYTNEYVIPIIKGVDDNVVFKPYSIQQESNSGGLNPGPSL